MALLAAGVIGAATSGFQIWQGNKQKKAGEDALSKLKRPETTIPDELYQNLSDAEKRQVEGLPAEQKAEFVKNLQRTRSQSLKASADRKGGLMGLQESMNQEVDAFSNLTAMDASARKESELRKQSSIERARGAIAGAKFRQQDVAIDRYNQDLQSAQGQIGAGQQNIMGGVQGLGSTALDIAGAGFKPGGGN